MSKTIKLITGIIFGPILWIILSLAASVVLGVSIFQAIFSPPKVKNYGLTPPDKSVIDRN